MGVSNRTIFALLVSNKRNTKKVKQHKKKLESCKTKKCPTNHARLRLLRKIHDKDLAKKCKQKDDMAYYNCSVKVFNKSEYKKAKEEYKACNEKECLKEYEALIKELEG